MKANRNIYDVLDELAQQRTYDEYDDETRESVDLDFEDVEGELEGVGWVVGNFKGVSDVTHYSYDAGDYWQPPYCELEAEYSGEFTYTTFDCEDEKTITIKKRQIW